jgi:hypothetical protein
MADSLSTSPAPSSAPSSAPSEAGLPRESQEPSSLEDVRMSLAGEVLAFLSSATPDSRARPPYEDRSDPRLTERQVLLRAAIRDLKVMDVRLHHDRH